MHAQNSSTPAPRNDDDAHLPPAQRAALAALTHALGGDHAAAARALRALAEAACACWWVRPQRSRVPLGEVALRVPDHALGPTPSSWRVGLIVRALGLQILRRGGRTYVTGLWRESVLLLSHHYQIDPFGSLDAGLSAERGRPVDRARPGAP